MLNNQSVTIQKHSLLQSVVLHLFPGVVIGIVYFILVNPITNMGYPTIMALLLSVMFTLIPLEIGILWLMKRKTGAQNYRQLIAFRESIPLKSYILWIISIIVIAGLIFAITEPISVFLRNSLYAWIPDTHYVDFGYSEDFSPTTLLVTYISGFVVLAIIAPTIEELYFRGYLLPRIPMKQGYGGIFHSFLFALYHVWTPWMFVTRTIGFYPFVYAVQKKQNILIVIIGHCVVNMIDFIVGFVFLIEMTT